MADVSSYFHMFCLCVIEGDLNLLEIFQVAQNCRVALRNDSYTLHKILPNKVSTMRKPN